jgi:hypothetical protein
MKTIPFQDEKYSKSDLKTMTGSELVSLRNLIAANMDLKPIKKFRDLETAITKTWEILNQYENWDPQEGNNDNSKKSSSKKEETQVIIEPEEAFRFNTKMGVGEYMCRLIIGKPTEEAPKLANGVMDPDLILAKVKQKFPDSKATYADVACNKTDVRKAGYQVPIFKKPKAKKD